MLLDIVKAKNLKKGDWVLFDSSASTVRSIASRPASRESLYRDETGELTIICLSNGDRKLFPSNGEVRVILSTL